MLKTYLLMEGVNIYPNVLDTDQLSIIRGSSFALKRAIEHIEGHFKARLTSMTTGASSGIFLVGQGVDVEPLLSDIATELEKSTYRHFTFAIEYCQAEDLLQAKEQLLAQLRFHQLSGISMVPDRFDQDHQRAGRPCELEGHRIAASGTERKVQVGERDTPRLLSLSIYDRLLFGRKQRQNFYFKEGEIGNCKELEDYGFTDDLENLADDSRYPKLNNKIAVIYMDGNKFSFIQKEILQRAKQKGTNQEKAQKGFDDAIQGKRSAFLKKTLLDMVSPEPRFKDAIIRNGNGKDAIRFETLLWGGDEMLFVLPAWSGFELLQSFFQESAEWSADTEPLNDSDHQKRDEELNLTHAAGIVFCSSKTPIRIIREIAQSLADTIKVKLGDDRKKNRWDYMVLESIDYPVSNDIDDFNRERYGKALAERRPRYLSPATNWDQSKKELIRLITDDLLSRRQLYRIVDTLNKQCGTATISWSDLAGGSNNMEIWKSATPQELAERRMFLLLKPELRSELAKILPRLASDLFDIDEDDTEKRAWLWLNLIELWDYLVPVREDA